MRHIRLVGTALLLDGILAAITLPLAHLAAGFLLPSGVVVGPQILWTYGLVILSILLVVLLYLLWTFEGMYQHLFSFWQLVITMMVIMMGILFMNRGSIL